MYASLPVALQHPVGHAYSKLAIAKQIRGNRTIQVPAAR